MCARDAQPGMASESDDSDLRERVEQLEATVEQQQATIKKMLPGRRGALKAGGLLAGGGLLGALGSDQAAAADGTQDTSAGTIGAAGDSTDIYLDQLLDPGGDEILNVDDTGDINAAFGRTWDFDSVDLQNSSLNLGSLSTDELSHNIEGGNDLSGSRSFDTEFQNTTGQNIFVTIRLEISSGTSGEFNTSLLVANSSGLGFNPDSIDYVRRTDSGTSNPDLAALQGIIPDGGYYMVDNSGTNVSLNAWFERKYL